jgi:hypothetical protein
MGGWESVDETVEQFKPQTELIGDTPKTLATPAVPVDDFSFDFDESEDTSEKKEIYTVYGHKNDGKTTISYGIPHTGDKVLVFSFDNKSTRPKDAPYITAGKLQIKVMNAVKYLDKSSEAKYLETSAVTHAYILSLLQQATTKFAPDWVMFDGTEMMSGIMEIVMRSKNNLKPYQGIANRSLWRERRQYIDDIHMKSMEVASKGLIYTMYSQKDEIIDQDGTVMKKVDIPKWIGSVMEETDIVVHAETKFENNRKVFYARVEGSKIPDKYPDGVYNVTNKRFRDVVEVTTS